MPFIITGITGIVLILFDWLLIEGLVQYALRTTDKGFLVNHFKNKICWYEVFYDLGVGTGQFIFETSTWNLMTGNYEFVYTLPTENLSLDLQLANGKAFFICL